MRSHPATVASSLALAMACICSVIPAPAAAEGRAVKVGVYENEPKVFVGEGGEPAGLFIDVLAAIAKAEDWTVEYVICEWSDCLDSLEEGRIDLMPDVAYSVDRDAIYDFNRAPVVQSWSQVYSTNGAAFVSMSDLGGKRVAVLEGSIQHATLEKMILGFAFATELVETDSMEDAFEAARDGRADAAVANHFFGGRFYRDYGLEKTPVVFQSADLHFAAAEGRNRDLLDAIDRHLEEWRGQGSSPYYKALSRWMDPGHEPSLPSYMLWIVGCLLGLLTIALALVWLFRMQVRHRTENLVLAREHLRQAQKMESMGRLAGGVAHDFNNLLIGIIGFTDFAIQKLPGSHEAVQDLEEVVRAGERAADLTRQLLAFSRKQMLSPKIVDLNEIVGGIEKMLRRLLGEDVEISTSLAKNLHPVEVDPGQIEQVIMNLAVNARDAMPDGGKLSIETAEVTLDAAYADRHGSIDAGNYVLLSVLDTGCGMDTHTVERIFEPFFTTKDAEHGTGLGLSTVYGIVKQSGGGILVYSEPGDGTVFKVFLPWAAPPKQKPARERPSAVSGGSETILLVEDDGLVRMFAERILRGEGYHLLVARDGEEALRMVAEGGVSLDLLLTDVVMPLMGGKDLAEKLLSIQPEVSVLFMSGYTDPRIFPHGDPDSRVAFFAKPFSGANLLTKVREQLDSRPR